ncbi:uncharacterized protein TNCV_4645231 [Trichonephila clavipes]|nr:uncharacterized protein TNCV_4645231 [Trichonephila clavipes]
MVRKLFIDSFRSYYPYGLNVIWKGESALLTFKQKSENSLYLPNFNKFIDNSNNIRLARISKAKRRKRVTRDMSTLKNSMLELAAKFDDNYNTGLIKSFMFGLNKTEIKTMTDILSRYKFRDSHARISKAKRRKRVTRDMSTLKNSMLELAAKFDDNYNTGLIKSFMFGLNKTEIKTMTDILSRYKFRDSHARISKAKRRKRVTRDMSTLKNSMLELAAKFDDNYNTGLIKSFMFGLNKTEIKTMTDILSRYKFRDSHARISKAKRRKRVTRDMSTLKNSMLELAAKFDDNYNTGLIKSFMFGLNKTEIKTMTDILSRYKFRDSHARISKAKRRKRVTRDMSTLKNSMLELAAKFDDNYNTGLIKSFMFGLNKTEIKTMTDILSRYKFRDSHDHEYPFNFLRSYIHHKYINRLATSNSKSTTQQ